MVGDLPFVGDSEEELVRIMRMYNPTFTWRDVEIMEDYPLGSDHTFLLQYIRGTMAPFIDFLVYIDLGVGFVVKGKNFSSDEAAKEAEEKFEKWREKVKLDATLNQFATYREVIGRATIIYTFNVNGGFYYNENEKVTGVDAINPMTLDDESIKNVMVDTTGTEEYLQIPKWTNTPMKNVQGAPIIKRFTQDRVIYVTRNPLTKWSSRGISALQNCLTDARTISKFPRYRSDMARKFSNIHRHFKVLSELLQQTQYGNEVLNDPQESKKYLDDIHSIIKEQEQKSASIATFDFITSEEVTYGGKEPDISGIERMTLESLAMKLGIPLSMVAFADQVNRASMDVLVDLFIKKRENGVRKQVYVPIIKDIVKTFWASEGIYEGEVEVQFKPFLSKDLNALYARLGTFYQQTQALSLTEIREQIEYDKEMKRGPIEAEQEKRMKEMMEMQRPNVLGGAPLQKQNAPREPSAIYVPREYPERKRGIAPQPRPKTNEKAANMTEQVLIMGNKIRPLWFEE